MAVTVERDVGVSPKPGAGLGHVRDRIQEHVESGRSPSIAAAVCHRGDIVFAEVAGVQGPGGPPLSLDHIWPIASAGKPMVAATLMTLIQEGRLGLTERVVDYFPELGDAGPAELDVLVHHLLTHTTGWESPMFSGRRIELASSGELPDPPAGVDPFTHTDLYLGARPIRIADPGAQMQYASVHYGVLSEIIRRITDRSLDAAMKERIFGPLKMDRSAVSVDGESVPYLVTRSADLPFGSDDAPGGGTLQSDEFRSSDCGAAGIHVSPADLLRFGEMIRSHGVHGERQVLAPAAVRAMTTNQVPSVPAVVGDRVVKEASWGFGFGVICEERWPYFGGALVPTGSVSHPGAGGISFWIDFQNEIVGVFFEVITEITEPLLEPISGMGQRFQEMVTSALGR